MDVHVQRTSSNDMFLSGDNLRVGSANHIRCNPIHHIWISGFTNSNNLAVFDTYVGLYISPPRFHLWVWGHSLILVFTHLVDPTPIDD